MGFWDKFLGSGIEGAAKGLGSLAKDLRTAFTGEEAVSDATRLKLEEIAAALEQGEQQIVGEVNATMRAEAKSEHWMQWAWRPFWGFISALAFAGVVFFCLYLGKAAIVDGDSAKLSMVPQVITSFTALFSIPGAILGVTAWHRGKQKRNQ